MKEIVLFVDNEFRFMCGSGRAGDYSKPLVNGTYTLTYNDEM